MGLLDAEAVGVLKAVAHPFLGAAYVAQVECEVRDIYLPHAETYVLEADGEVVRFIALMENQIGGLFLDPSKHGKGYGRSLVDHAFSLKGPLTVEVFRDNRSGRPFYEHYGFQFVAEELHEPSGQLSHKMAMPAS